MYMHISKRKRLLLAALLPILALSVGGIAFAVTREVSPGGSARADTPVFGPTPPVGNQTPEWFVAPEQTRSAEPVLSDQVINGIHVGRDVRRQGGPCDGIPNNSAEIQTRPYADAQASFLGITPKYLPRGSVEETSQSFSNSIFCGRVLAHTQRRFEVPADPKTGRLGGHLIISRSVGGPYETVVLPAKDFSAGSVSGRNAVFVKPTTPEGFGQSVIVIAEQWGVTTIDATGLTFAEVQRIAEGLY
jgi:hypothetical protein